MPENPDKYHGDFQSGSEEETALIARNFALRLKPYDFVSVKGPLGAGKTMFISAAVSFFCGLNGKDTNVLSPTFSIMNSYDCGTAINHYDFYRLEGVKDLENIGFFDSIGKKAITIVEWPEKINCDYKRYVKGDYYSVDIKPGNRHKRHITIKKSVF